MGQVVHCDKIGMKCFRRNVAVTANYITYHTQLIQDVYENTLKKENHLGLNLNFCHFHFCFQLYVILYTPISKKVVADNVKC